MIPRLAIAKVREALGRQAAVCLIGPRQVGKTTLALQIAEETEAVYLDLERLADREKLSHPELYLSRFEKQLVILDEIHRVPQLFETLRGLIDRGRRQGFATGRYLILGSASLDLLKQSGESLAGRIAYLELSAVGVLEIDSVNASTSLSMSDCLWLRGGFPDSLLARSDMESMAWRLDFIRTYLERDIPMFGSRVPSESLERLWTMLAHGQGSLLNASNIARSLSVSTQSVTRYIDLFVDLLLVRRLRPYHANIGKRLVKSPKVYVRDSGLLHALLSIETFDRVSGHPVVGASWEGFVIENLLSVTPWRVQPFFYRTIVGAEIDLVLEFPNGALWAVEVKRGLSAKPSKGFHIALDDLKPERAFIVYSGRERYPVSENIEVIGVQEMAAMLAP